MPALERKSKADKYFTDRYGKSLILIVFLMANASKYEGIDKIKYILRAHRLYIHAASREAWKVAREMGEKRKHFPLI